MSRLVFGVGEQNRFLKNVGSVLKADSDDLGRIVGISGRSFRDWINEKTLGIKDKMLKLSEMSGIKLPVIIDEREEWWSGRINGESGALARMKIYGPPGNSWGRRKGGIVSQQKRKEYPDYYRQLGCPIPRDFNCPRSARLAEFFGTVLGDGGIRPYQLTITLNSEAAKELFGYNPHVFKIKNCKAVCITYSGVNLIQFLVDNGLKIGD